MDEPAKAPVASHVERAAGLGFELCSRYSIMDRFLSSSSSGEWAGNKLNEIRDWRDPWACRIDIDKKIFRCFTAKRKTKKSP